jgi:hypothetical protein
MKSEMLRFSTAFSEFLDPQCFSAKAVEASLTTAAFDHRGARRLAAMAVSPSPTVASTSPPG